MLLLEDVVLNVREKCGFSTKAILLTSMSIQSQSHFTAESQSVCLGVEPTLWTFDQILLLFQEFGSGTCCPVSVGCPLYEKLGLSFVPCQL
jgi:hypothetical protein